MNYIFKNATLLCQNKALRNQNLILEESWKLKKTFQILSVEKLLQFHQVFVLSFPFKRLSKLGPGRVTRVG